jgi:hypothetical protein
MSRMSGPLPKLPYPTPTRVGMNRTPCFPRRPAAATPTDVGMNRWHRPFPESGTPTLTGVEMNRTGKPILADSEATPSEWG